MAATQMLNIQEDFRYSCLKQPVEELFPAATLELF